MRDPHFERKFWSVSWPIALVLIIASGAALHYTVDLGFWGSLLPPLFIVTIYFVTGTMYLRSRRMR